MTDSCDVLIAGGGPAGSACAWALRASGLDVLVVDAATFPRDKVCAGWITPQVVDALALDLEDYRRDRTLQPITGFRTGIIGDSRTLQTAYDRPAGFGIRRSEFDHYLLQRSAARLLCGVRIDSIRRDGGHWIVNDAIQTKMLVGAGGHFCPVARALNEGLRDDRAPLVVAQEAEFADPGGAYVPAAGQPELYFCRDVKGYGWCFRKEQHVNIGIGRLDRRSLPRAGAEFVAFLKETGRIPADAEWRWRGHAYLLQRGPRRVVGDGVLLVGDAAGLAYPESGEGIRPAIESGLLAAAVILDDRNRSTLEHLARYPERLRARFGRTAFSLEGSPRGALGERFTAAVARALLQVPLFVRRVVLDQWFLHANLPPLVH